MDKKANDLQQLRIHELRDLARKMGVNAPTSKKKEDIIEEILKIMSGEIVPLNNSVKKGRPARESLDNFSFVDFIVPRSEEFHDKVVYRYKLNEDRMSFALNSNPAEYLSERDFDETFTRQGLIEIKENYGIIHSEGLKDSIKDVFVNKNFISQLDIKDGELVICECKTYKIGHPDVALKVERLEKKPANDFDKATYRKSKNIVKVTIDGLTKFDEGGRYFVNPKDHYAKTYELAKNMAKLNPNYKVETLYLNGMEDRVQLDGDFNTSVVSFVRSDKEVVTLTDLFIESMKRHAEMGENIILIISEISQYLKSCNNMDKEDASFTTISSNAIVKTKRLLSCAKHTDFGSITIVAVDQLRTPLNVKNAFEYEILPLFE